VFVEQDRRALDAIGTNVEHTGFGARARVVRSDVGVFLAGLPPPEAPFDLAFADPPYDATTADVQSLVERLAEPGWLAPGATVSVERPVGAGVALPEGFGSGWERRFGDTLVVFVEPSDLAT
jgi:16S rRNA G966 N2-methylase RsmD